MLAAGLVFAGLAAALHVYIFWMESIAWGGAAARRTFGRASAEELALTRPLAFNQGFYNLFLAIVAVVGIVLTVAGATTVGAALVLAGTGSMLAAAVVLLASVRGKARAAVTQGALPLLAVVATSLGLLV